MWGKKYKDTEEEVLEYFFGREFVEQHKVQNHKFWFNREAESSGDSGDREKTTNIRQARFLIITILISSAIMMSGTSAIFFFPKIFYYAGIVKKPAAVAIGSSNSAANIAIKLAPVSTPEWQGNDFVQQVEYTISNKSDQFAYVHINVKILNASGKEIDTMDFVPNKEVLAAGEEIVGNFRWDKSKTENAKKVNFIWNITFRSINILDDGSSKPNSTTKPSKSAPAGK